STKRYTFFQSVIKGWPRWALHWGQAKNKPQPWPPTPKNQTFNVNKTMTLAKNSFCHSRSARGRTSSGSVRMNHPMIF
ncbi:MAG: hypothetical protein KA214_04430, partial [Neisseriaceae bacterium]|nr:hypothetical protein [Neisseriaceae bacterium]